MPEESAKRYEKEGLGYEKIEEDGQVTVEKGEVRVRRVNGEDISVEGTVKVYTGDTIYWGLACHFSRQHGN
ncbi:hypothetical protein OPT61_g8468 [Boeremia exigua]|uniref:Uncharacterized protein n=1 Tax=Boeremia exigua TaxID=749465 RepID=A0ACC2HY77_9PLEO|nr:hypothetical protein OPT61_g8468 [Boeremia exigua]